MSKNKTVGIVVLGDIGRSPRMNYHAFSLNKEGFKVKVLGYDDTKISNNLLNGVEIVDVKQSPSFSKSWKFSCPSAISYWVNYQFWILFAWMALENTNSFDELFLLRVSPLYNLCGLDRSWMDQSLNRNFWKKVFLYPHLGDFCKCGSGSKVWEPGAKHQMQ